MKKVVILAILFPITTSINAQSKEEIAAKKLLLGYNIGSSFSNLITKDPTNHSIKHNGAGFNIGIILEEKVNQKISLIPKAEIWFSECHLEYANNTSKDENYQVFPIHGDFMLHITYKLNNTKTPCYVLAGPNIKVPINQKGGTNKTQTYTTDLALDLGVGFEKTLNYFQFAPELRYSMGLLNLNTSSSSEKIYFHSVSLILNFKG